MSPSAPALLSLLALLDPVVCRSRVDDDGVREAVRRALREQTVCCDDPRDPPPELAARCRQETDAGRRCLTLSDARITSLRIEQGCANSCEMAEVVLESAGRRYGCTFTVTTPRGRAEAVGNCRRE